MVKECLRYGIDPFIIDDKHRGEYNRGIANWKTNPYDDYEEVWHRTIKPAEETAV